MRRYRAGLGANGLATGLNYNWIPGTLALSGNSFLFRFAKPAVTNGTCKADSTLLKSQGMVSLSSLLLPTFK